MTEAPKNKKTIRCKTSPSTDSATSKGQQAGYIRVSSTDQNTARQLEGLVLDRTFTNKASGSPTLPTRPRGPAWLCQLFGAPSVGQVDAAGGLSAYGGMLCSSFSDAA